MEINSSLCLAYFLNFRFYFSHAGAHCVLLLPNLRSRLLLLRLFFLPIYLPRLDGEQLRIMETICDNLDMRDTQHDWFSLASACRKTKTLDSLIGRGVLIF